MMRPARAENAEERLDQPITDDRAHRRSLTHLRDVNRWLGGIRALQRTLAHLIVPGARVALVDVGCGSADVPLALLRWAAARGCHVSILAIDRGLAAARMARHQTRDATGIRVVCADALALPLGDASVDVAMMTLTLHHFEGPGRPAVLRELARVSGRLVIVSDLERNWPNYVGARLLAATVWRSNRFTRHDAPLSVRRGFTPGELLADLRDSGLRDARVSRRFFYRLVGTGTPPSSAATAQTL